VTCFDDFKPLLKLALNTNQPINKILDMFFTKWK